MQELLKEWFVSKEGARRFKTFREKKREIDKQCLELLEEQDKKYNSNFAIVYREILEKDLKLSFRNVISLWRTKEKK
jgi:phenylpropionate dioxygenase-like ring-hydroxylating dioxygenase large terminal subunit